MEKEQAHGHDTRFKRNILPLKLRLSLFDKSPRYIALKIYNEFPSPI